MKTDQNHRTETVKPGFMRRINQMTRKSEFLMGLSANQNVSFDRRNHGICMVPQSQAMDGELAVESRKLSSLRSSVVMLQAGSLAVSCEPVLWPIGSRTITKDGTRTDERKRLFLNFDSFLPMGKFGPANFSRFTNDRNLPQPARL
jgi:hypothetical protein